MWRERQRFSPPVMRFTVRGNAPTVPIDGRTPGLKAGRAAGELEYDMLRILVDGEGSRAVELCIRAALGDRADEEEWLITAVKLPARWVVSFLVSPDDRLGGYSWCGPAHQVRSAVENALRRASLGKPARTEACVAGLAG